MDSEDGLEPILIPSEEAIVQLTLDCNTVKDLQMYLRQMVEANSKSLVPVRVCAHFYLGAYATFNVFPHGKPGIVSSGNNLAENAASGSNVEGLEQTARPVVHAPNEELHQHALSLHSENAIKSTGCLKSN
jgi:hypothetical protein